MNDGIALLLRAVDLGERHPAVLLRLASALANNGRGRGGASAPSLGGSSFPTAKEPSATTFSL